MRWKWRRFAVCSGLVAASVISSYLLSGVQFFELVNLKLQDTHFLLRKWIAPQAVPVSNIVLLTMDRETLATFPEVQLFWHPYYAQAIKAAAAAGAKVLVLDVAFGIPVSKWEPDNDRILAEAVATTASTMPVICAYVPALTEKQKEWPVPINMLAPALGLAAWANLTDDADDFIRQQELLAPDDGAAPGTPMTRSMALRAAEKYVGEDAQFRNGHLYLKGREIPISPDRRIVINYAGPPQTVPRVSLAKFIAAARAGEMQQLRDWVGGKVVLLGPDSSIEDRHATPLFTLFSGKEWLTPGVEIHANTINTILSGKFLVPAPQWLRLLGLLLVGALTVSVAVGSSSAWLAALAAAIYLATHLLFRAGTILSTAELLADWLVAMLAGIIYRNITAEKKSAFFRSAVALFVGRQVATSLDESQKIGLTGKRQNVTILFTDIRGFTAFCEEKDPAVVVELLNEYMGKMVSIIHTWHGHVNKFIGDGILAVFCDDDPEARPGDHALRATRCAIEMVTAPSRFKTGAGLHSGPVVIGNVGSAEKMEFTVLGDTVNLASRLESLNKEHKTRLLLSEFTCELLGNQVQLEYLGSVSIRGKTLPMKIYTAAALIEAKQGTTATVGSEER